MIRVLSRAILPVVTMLMAILLIWYGAALRLNMPWAEQQLARDATPATFTALAVNTMSQDRPVLPTPHQVARGWWEGVAGHSITSKRSLVWHAWVTLQATALGFFIGTAAGIILAIAITGSRVMELSVMPWAVASQTVPILAIAPMVIVVMASLGVTGLMPKAVIAAWLSFFPVLVGMVKGLRAPDAMQLDLMRTWNASGVQTLLRLRLPASLPYLFASLKIAVTAALVGTIVGELPAGATAGLGARLLSGSYYGQTIQIWAALFMAAALAAALVMAITLIERAVLARMGLRP